MKYQLTNEQIQLFRELTPIKIDGELVPFKICCDGKWYKDPRGNTSNAIYITDYECKISTLYPETKVRLQKHFVNFMSQLFEGYAEDYLAYQEQKAEAMNSNI